MKPAVSQPPLQRWTPHPAPEGDHGPQVLQEGPLQPPHAGPQGALRRHHQPGAVSNSIVTFSVPNMVSCIIE